MPSWLRMEVLARPRNALFFGLAVALLLFFFQERINAPPPWDGRIYTNIALDPVKSIFNVGLTEHSVQRVLPSLIVNAGLRLLRLPLNDSHVVAGFAILHILQFALIAYFFAKSMAVLKVAFRAQGIVQLLLFSCFFTLKNAFVYPTLTDVSGLLLGSALAYAYLASSTVGVLAVGLLGIVTWPLVPYLAIPLLLFPRLNLRPGKAIVRIGRPHVLLAVTGVAFAIALALPQFWPELIRAFVAHVPPEVGFASVRYIEPLIPVAMLISLACLAIALGYLWNDRQLFSAAAISTSGLPAGFVACAVLLFARHAWLSLGDDAATGHVYGIADILYATVVLSFAKPAIFLAAHAGFFGLLFVMLATAWSATTVVVREHGLGLVLAVTLVVLLSFNLESRYSLACFPLLVPFMAKATEERLLRISPLWLLLLANLIASKAYVPMTKWNYHTGVRELVWPYLENHGPWMTNKGWFAHVLLLAALLAVLIACGWFRYFRAARARDGTGRTLSRKPVDDADLRFEP